MIYNYAGEAAEIVTLKELIEQDLGLLSDWKMLVEPSDDFGDGIPRKTFASNLFGLRPSEATISQNSGIAPTLSFREYKIYHIADGVTTLSIIYNATSFSENYILFDNTRNDSDLVITLSSLNFNSDPVDDFFIPEEGFILVPGTRALETSYIVQHINNTYQAVLTKSGILK